MSRISRRVAAIAPSATIAVDTRAKMLKSMGEKVVNFGAGEPDFPTPDDVVEAAAAACTDPRNHKYTPIPGLPELRQAVAAKAARESRLAVHPAQVLVTNGAKQAVFTAYAVLVDPGDEVLLPAPYWTTYPEAIALSGGVPVPVMADETTGFKVSVEQLEAARTPRTKALNFVSPSNPTGAVYSRDEIIAIGRWAAEHDVYVVTDEIYEHLVYAGARHFSMPALVGELEDRCLVVSGVAKSYSMTGWRVGWMIGPRDLVDAGANLQSHLSSNVANVSQRAALAALLGGLDSVKEM
ncbi:MAG: pyridoxal phosphate-dependent aminotransferase, partial [Acidimicrobiales bacterium]